MLFSCECPVKTRKRSLYSVPMFSDTLYIAHCTRTDPELVEINEYLIDTFLFFFSTIITV